MHRVGKELSVNFSKLDNVMPKACFVFFSLALEIFGQTIKHIIFHGAAAQIQNALV